MARIQELETQVTTLSMQLARSQHDIERAKIKDSLVALKYLSLGVCHPKLGFRPLKKWCEFTSYRVLVALLSLRPLQDPSFKEPSFVSTLSLVLGHALPQDILRQVSSLIPKNKRDQIIRIRCESLSDYPPEPLLFRLLNNLGRAKMEQLLGQLAPIWGFSRPKNRTWCQYFDTNLGTEKKINEHIRDQAMVNVLDAEMWEHELRSHPTDRCMALIAAHKFVRPLPYISKALRRDREIALAVLKNDF